MSDKKTQTAIKIAVEEISNTWLQIESLKEHVKDIVSNTSETHEYDKKLLLKVAKARHKRILSTIKEDNEKLIDEYESLYGED